MLSSYEYLIFYKYLYLSIVWSYEQFLNWLNRVEYECSKACSTSSTRPREVPTATLESEYCFEQMLRFEAAFFVIMLYLFINKENILIKCNNKMLYITIKGLQGKNKKTVYGTANGSYRKSY